MILNNSILFDKYLFDALIDLPKKDYFIWKVNKSGVVEAVFKKKNDGRHRRWEKKIQMVREGDNTRKVGQKNNG